MNTTTSKPADQLRREMVEEIERTGTRSARVLGVMGKVPREIFLPDVTVEEAYEPGKAVVIKRSDTGATASCSSVPTLVATQLDQLNPQDGDNILEIAAGTGVNAAYLRELVGPAGYVTTIDYDEGVTAHARKALDAAGYPDVEVITRDGALGDIARGPYQGIIVTVGAPDIFPAWWEQLTPGGRLVVPLRFRGTTRTLGLTLAPGRFVSDSVELCGFIPMIGQDGERVATIDTADQVSLFWDPDQPIDPDALTGVLNGTKTETWTDATVRGDESFDGVWLRLAATEPGTCRIAAEPAAIKSGLCTPAIPSRSPALVEADSLAYFASRRVDEPKDGPRWKLGAIGHGPDGAQLVDRLCDQIKAWDRDRTGQPQITVYPAGATDDQIPASSTIDKAHIRLTISY